jgi:putative ABC transport system permease protein
MFRYQLQCAWVSLKRHPWMSTLIVLAISLGLAAAISTLTVVHRLSIDPLPSRSNSAFAVYLDTWDEDGWGGAGQPPNQVTYMDAMALYQRAPGKHAPMYNVSEALRPTRPELRLYQQQVRATTRHFFDVFDMRLVSGGIWTQADDDNGSAVAVITTTLKQKLFGDNEAVGKNLDFGGQSVRVLGVIEPLASPIRFYDVTQGPLQDAENMFMPLAYAINRELGVEGNTNCWKEPAPGFSGFLQSECTWLQLWVKLDDAKALSDYREFIKRYVAEQHELGRFVRTENNHVLNIAESMKMWDVVSDDSRLANSVGFAFFVVALINAVMLLLAKFLRGARSAAVHRALGASKRDLMRMHVLECALLGVISLIAAAGLTALMLALIRQLQPIYQKIAVLDPWMFATMAGLAIFGSIGAGLLPAWRISRLPPAQALRSN